MNPAACQQALEGVGSGVGASLRAIDCAASATAQAAFGRLFGSEGALLPALTILLTLFVALFAFALITGRSRIGIAALTPRMVTLGLVLTFATSWIAYQSVVWNLAVGAPDQIAGILLGSSGPATQIFADKIDVVLTALMDASGPQGLQGGESAFSPPGLMWLGGTLLLLGTVGVLATSKIALAVLLALGPVFVVLALFEGTRGLFTGWLKGVAMLALAPLFAVLGGTLMLELAVPVIRALSHTPGEIDARAAMAFFMIGAVHVALMAMVLKVAGTMVAGWSVFGLASSGATDPDGRSPQGLAARSDFAMAHAGALDPPLRPPAAPSREIRLSMPPPATAGSAGPATHFARSAIPIAASVPAAPGALALAGRARARGIGSRFRAPANARLARSMETSR